MMSGSPLATCHRRGVVSFRVVRDCRTAGRSASGRLNVENTSKRGMVRIYTSIQHAEVLRHYAVPKVSPLGKFRALVYVLPWKVTLKKLYTMLKAAKYCSVLYCSVQNRVQ